MFHPVSLPSPVPVKYETVVFCGLAPFQRDLYTLFITSPEVRKLLKGTGAQPLVVINRLKKLCNHPDLLDLPEELEGSGNLIPDEYLAQKRKARTVMPEYGGKFIVLER
jgi:DNA repair and recombination RAD54-like protein